ncbi:hypothetical protein A3C26_03055 [Candidatus Daviesbacteria bacterium RIFCSPHIGHO2_02_FULL_39_12]|uniref:Hydrolase TatD n=2 Tax=Candidatus Daviesiibacteriota TaxID=1752718 RepID=A0A1F5JE17_9BACT|nr:MAG: hypothetical protein A3C26_03055 [Candidatus Daviesbacteria bacterium RIFCSPHIGHO2_02_FULL_39_12]OGE71436.1 MAG: hypothetical protein A3H40_02825 [Candidatus Daviesbacteria bacterium RIFCSPLOWO2_02_FULL_38_15]
MLIDTHAHLYWDLFSKDLNEVIDRSLEARVTTIINVGIDIEKSKQALKQTEKLSKIKNLSVYSTIGIHPHEAVKFGGLDELEEIYKSNPEKVVAVGECGLDYFLQEEYIKLPDGTSLSEDQVKNLQRKLFQAQIDLAKKLNLPLIVHCRDDRSKNPSNTECWDEVLEMTKDWFGIYHCYSGLPHNTKYIIHNTNFLISFAAIITYPKNDYLREAAKILPLERIVLETDCPFLPPQSKRGQRNEPAGVREIAEVIANLKRLPLEEIALQTTKNVKIVFNL